MNTNVFSARNDERHGGRLFQADLLALEGGELSFDAYGYGQGVDVTVCLAVPRAAQALVTEGPAFGGARRGRRLPHGVVFGVFDGEVAGLGCHAVDAAVHVAVQYQRAADALPEHRDQRDVKPFETALVVAVDGQRVDVVFGDGRDSPQLRDVAEHLGQDLLEIHLLAPARVHGVLYDPAVDVAADLDPDPQELARAVQLLPGAIR